MTHSAGGSQEMKNKSLQKIPETFSALPILVRIVGSSLFAFLLLKLFHWGVVWPFFFGWLLAYIYRPLVVRLMGLSVPSGWAAFIPCLLTYALFLFFFSLVPEYLSKISVHLSHYLRNQYDTSPLRQNAGHLYSRIQSIDPRIGDFLYQASSMMIRQAFLIVSKIVQGGFSLAQTGLTILFVPLIGFYFAKDWEGIGNHFYDLYPKPYRHFLDNIFREIKRVLSYYFHGQILVAIILALYYAVFLGAVLGLGGGIVIGCISGFLVFMPYVGIFLGFVISCSATLVQIGKLESLLVVAGIYATGGVLDSAFLTPFFVGKKIGVHPLWILFFIYGGFSIGGPLGVLASLPLACVGSVLCKTIYRHYVQTDFFQQGFLPISKK